LKLLLKSARQTFFCKQKGEKDSHSSFCSLFFCSPLFLSSSLLFRLLFLFLFSLSSPLFLCLFCICCPTLRFFVAGLPPFDNIKLNGLEVSQNGAVLKNTPYNHMSVVGRERFYEGRWKFRINAMSWAMFGVVDANKSGPLTYDSTGSYGIAPPGTYAHGAHRGQSTPLHPNDEVILELKQGMLSLTNLRSAQTTQVPVPVRTEYKLHFNFHGPMQVTWLE